MSDHRTDPRRWQVPVLLSAASCMTVLGSTILVTALPSIKLG